MADSEKLAQLQVEFMNYKDVAQRAAVEKVLSELRETKLFPDAVFDVLTPGRIFAMIVREMQTVQD